MELDIKTRTYKALKQRQQEFAQMQINLQELMNEVRNVLGGRLKMTEQQSNVVTHEEIVQMNQHSWDALLLMTDVIPRINGSGKVTLKLAEYEKVMNNVKMLQKTLLEITRLRTALSCIENVGELLALPNDETLNIMKELTKATQEGTEENHWAYQVLVTDQRNKYREVSEEL